MGAVPPGRCCCTEAQAGDGDAVVKSIPKERPVDVGVPALSDAPPEQEGQGEKIFEATSTEKMKDTLVRFIREATQGREVTIVKEGVGQRVQRVPAKFTVDPNLSELRFLPRDTAQPSVTCRLEEIQDLYSVALDGEKGFPRGVVSGLEEGEADRLLRLLYKPTGESARSFCFLEASEESLSMFMQGLKVLCQHAMRESSGST